MSMAEEQFYVVAPERTLVQRMDALGEANRIRMHRAQLKRDLKAGRVGLVDLLEDPDCGSMKLYEAVLALPKFGRWKTGKTLASVGISQSRTIGGLTRRQMNELVEALGDRAWPAPPELPRAA